MNLAERKSKPEGVRVCLLFFGAAREVAGTDSVDLLLTEGSNGASLRRQIIEAYPGLDRFGRSLLFAVNQEYAPAEQEIREGDEIAIFPPVSGGAAGAEDKSFEGAARSSSAEEHPHDFFELTTSRIDVGAVARRIVLPECGATVTLDGYARARTRGRPETLYLVYEAYEPMAESEMRKLGRRAHDIFPGIAHLGIVHRLGRTEIGETSVVISVGAPHRRAAFEACEWAIRELKRTVPIWKKEFSAGGEVWVEGEGERIIGE